MNTRMHGSEDALAEIPAGLLKSRGTPSAPQRVLIGGLGMGFTLASALAHFKADAEVVVAELVPGVITWNDGPLGAKAGYPIRNPRTTVENRDVAEVLREAPGGFDAIMLDVDNGPEGLTADNNDWLYSAEGLAVCARALRPAGILAVWSATADARFSQRLSRAGLKVEARQVYAHGTSGARHTIWIARHVDVPRPPSPGQGRARERTRASVLAAHSRVPGRKAAAAGNAVRPGRQPLSPTSRPPSTTTGWPRHVASPCHVLPGYCRASGVRR